MVAFGDAEDFERKRRADEMASEMPAPALAGRAAYKSADGRMGSYDLIDALEAGTAKLDKIGDERLPEEMRGMKTEEKRSFLEQKRAQRVDIQQRIARLTAEREEYIKAKLAESGAGDSFDARVLGMIRSQAADKGLIY